METNNFKLSRNRNITHNTTCAWTHTPLFTKKKKYKKKNTKKKINKQKQNTEYNCRVIYGETGRSNILLKLVY